MKNIAKLFVLLAVVSLVAAAAWAADDAKSVTVTGKLQCAKCVLKKADAKACQDVLVVTAPDVAEYYIVKNDVSGKFQMAGCKGDKSATITGTVAEKEGKKWITATKMEEVK